MGKLRQPPYLNNTKFNKWTIGACTKEYDAKSGWKYKVVCECGNTSVVSHQSLKRGTSKQCRDCGDKAQTESMKGRRKYKETWAVAAKRLYMNYKKTSAESRELDFKLSEEEFIIITSKSCYYCGTEPSSVSKTPTSEYTYNGIDRLDNSKGYIKDNCVPCCSHCNRAKWEMTENNFYSHIEKVYKHTIEKRRTVVPRGTPCKVYSKWTHSKFWSFIRSGLRAKWTRWPPKYEVMADAKRKYKGSNKRQKFEYKCSKCKKYYMQKEVEVDHIIPCGTLRSYEDIGTFVEKLFVSKEKLRVVCKPCHKKITKKDKN